MSYTITHSKKIRSEISIIKQDVALLRSLLIGMLGRDKEGDYRPSFVRKVLRAAREKPTHVFRGAGSLLVDIQNAK